MHHFTIAQKLIVGFGLIIVTLVASLVFALSRLDAVNQLMSEVVNEDWQKAVLANESALLMNAIARQSFSLILFDDQNAPAEIDKSRQAITQRLEQLQPLIRIPEGIQLMDEVQHLRSNYVNSYLQVLDELRLGNQSRAHELMQHQAMPDLDRLLPKMYDLVSLQGRILQSNGQKVDHSYHSTRQLLWVIMLLAFIGSSVLSLWIVRSVTKPLGGEPLDVKQAVERIAAGDLQEAVIIKKDDQKSLMAAMARMQASLKTMLQGMADNADGTAGAAIQLSAASRQINNSSQMQTESSTGMAAAIEQMTVSIGEVSSNASQALSITSEAQQLSKEGEQAFYATVENMHKVADTVSAAAQSLVEMTAQSDSASSIIQLISDVAEQTNLLALNAAIEAARAGGQGRGFAVVADEVRQLAERTSLATADIGSLIGNVQSTAQVATQAMQSVEAQVEEGVQLVERSASMMRDIGAGAGQVQEAVNNITQTLQEQNSVSAEIAQRIEQIAQMSEENHQAISEVMHTAEMLEGLATNTQGSIRFFRF